MLFLVGGPSHIDTWDPKPDAPAEVRGPFKPIATNVPGMQITEIFPQMAQLADKFSLIRSVYHTATAVHDTGHQMMQTGRLFTGGIEHPHVGCVLGYLKGQRGEVPAHVLLPAADRPHRRQPAARPDRRLPRQAARPVRPQRRPRRRRTSRCPTCCRRTTSPPSGPTAGRSCATPSTARSTSFENSAAGQAARRQLRPGLSADVQPAGPRGVRPGPGAGRRSATATAGRASASSCLLARRLIERGVRFVTVNMFETVFDEITWDIHGSRPFTDIAEMARAGRAELRPGVHAPCSRTCTTAACCRTRS